MNFAIDLMLVFLVSWLAVIRLKERALYLIFAVAYVQNFFLAYLYTNRLVGVDLCRSFIFFKEFLLLALFLYSLMLFRHSREEWPRPLTILMFFSIYCILRFGFGALFQNDLSMDGIRKLRMVCYPLQIITVSMVISWLRPQFAKRFVRHMVYFLAVLAVFGIVLFLLPGTNFWKEHVDIASYNTQIKGDDPDTVIEEQGIPGTGMGREAFLFLSSFRAMGTFADPLAFGFAVAVPVVLLTFYYKPHWINVLMLVVSTAALCFTFSRSCWVFVAISCFYVWIRRRKYLFSLSLVAIGIILLVMWPPLAEFASSDFYGLSNPTREEHAQGLVWFYQRAFLDEGNILGKGMPDKVQTIPESGYAFLLEHFGLAAYTAFIWFCFSVFLYIQKSKENRSPLILIGQAFPVCILIVLHTSQYPFAFVEYLFIWFIVGMCLHPASSSEGTSHEIQPLSA